MTMTPDFDSLAAQASTAGTPEAKDALWAAAFQLERWSFVARGMPDHASPFVGLVDGRPFMLAFTDDQRATAFAMHNGLGYNGGYPILSAGIPHSIRTAEAMAEQGAFGIMFNNGPSEFFAPIADLRPMLDRFGGG